MNKIILLLMFCGLPALAGCTSEKAKAAFTLDTAPLTTKNVDAVKGQKATCAGPAVKTFNLEAIETNVNLGMGTSLAAWTYNAFRRRSSRRAKAIRSSSTCRTKERQPTGSIPMP